MKSSGKEGIAIYLPLFLSRLSREEREKMTIMARVVDEPDLVRDSNGIIQNVNEDDFHRFIAQRQQKEQELNRIQKLESDVSEMKSNLNLILKLLQDDNK